MHGPFNERFVFLDSSAAEFLARCNVRAIGIDGLSLGSREAHRYLLQKNIPIVEGLRLKHVVQGQYIFLCLPLAMRGVDAAPARAILFDQPFW